MIEADVVIVGGGPAGAATALNLAALRRVVVVDRHAQAAPRIGESLSAASGRLLADMGLWPAFLADDHRPCLVNRSIWGADWLTERDALRDPDGHGWHLDRFRFEAMLRQAAMARGAAWIAPAHPADIRRDGDGWRLTLRRPGADLPVRARFLVDAGGRGSSLARTMGAVRVVEDKLACGWLHGRALDDEAATLIEAEPDGWWYSAPLPGGRRVLAFHTDADLPAAACAQSADRLLARAVRLPLMADMLAQSDFTQPTSGFCAAHTAYLEPAWGDGWLATGDAATAFDPLSSQGLFNSLYTGLAAAQTIDAHLSSDADAVARYGDELGRILATYREHIVAWYGQERRWPDRPFWRRRRQVTPRRSASVA